MNSNFSLFHLRLVWLVWGFLIKNAFACVPTMLHPFCSIFPEVEPG